jgi:hypothetical protein
MRQHPHNTKFLLLQVPSPIKSPSGAAMLRARGEKTNSSMSKPKPTTLKRSFAPKDSIVSQEIQRYAQLYAVFGSPPRFDLCKGRYRRRSREFGRTRRTMHPIFTSTPLPGKPNQFFYSKGRHGYWNRLAKRAPQPLLKKGRY